MPNTFNIPPDQDCIGSWTSYGLNSETVRDTISSLPAPSKPDRFQDEQRHQFGTGSRHPLRGSYGFIVGLLLIGTSAGCSFFIPPASEEKLNSNQSYWFHYEASRRGGFLVGTDSDGKSKVKMCAEPVPDVALARTVEVIAKGAYQGATAEAQAKLSEQLAQLGGRTETVLILREALFRLCELSINSGLPPTELQSLYRTVVEAVVDLAKADLTNAQATAAKATTELKKTETERMKTFNSLSPDIQQQFAPQ